MPELTIIIPVLNEAAIIVECLARLQTLREGGGTEILVVDGGSSDATVALARPLADRVLAAPASRAGQMNAGAAIAQGDTLLFLHADCALPEDADGLVVLAMNDHRQGWGFFEVDIVGRHPMLKVIAWFMNRRSKLTGIASGDQAMFVRRSWFAAAGGFPAIPLMEDIAMSRGLRARYVPVCLQAKVKTSARRWHKQGVFRTILRMWWLRLRYFLGADPSQLARLYDRP
jgi:rSAM/selenodomain-associated transferase 2